jgi:hypothetical protein
VWYIAIDTNGPMPLSMPYIDKDRLVKSTKSPLSPSALSGATEAHVNGILGKDIVVGITDTGLYMDHDQLDQPSPRRFNTIQKDARKVE